MIPSCQCSSPRGKFRLKAGACRESLIMDRPIIATVPDALTACHMSDSQRKTWLQPFQLWKAAGVQQSWTCGKVLATNLGSRWICLTSYPSRLHYFSRDKFTISPFQWGHFSFFFSRTNLQNKKNKGNEALFGKSIAVPFPFLLADSSDGISLVGTGSTDTQFVSNVGNGTLCIEIESTWYQKYVSFLMQQINGRKIHSSINLF